MQWMRIALHRITALFSRRKSEGELQEELRTHIAALTDQNIQRGMDAQEAEHAARRAFGGVEQIKEIYREHRGIPFLEKFLQDLRFALRGMRRAPGHAAIAILTLALGIGATTAVFSVVDRILFRNLPYPHDERLVSFGFIAPIEQNEFMLGTDYLEWRAQQAPFEAVTSMRPGVTDCDITEQNPARLNCAAVEYTFLPTLGVQPVLGRNFSQEEDRLKAPSVALLSYEVWRGRFGRSTEIVGKTIQLDGHPVRIIGVLPANFEMPTLVHADLLVPEALDEATQRRPNTGAVLRAFARLKPTVTTQGAESALEPLFEESLKFVPPSFQKEVHLKVVPLRERQVQNARLSSWILLGSVLAVLLLACTNVANLLLARSTARRREFAVRMALGAGRPRLIRQTLTESLLLGFLGGAAGCGVAYELLHIFIFIAPAGILRLEQASLDLRVLLFTLAISLACGVLFGLAPALQLPEAELLGGKEVQGTARGLLRQVLVSAQIAVSLVLLVAAGLLIGSLHHLQNAPTGMEAQNVVTETVVLGNYRYPDRAQQFHFFTELEKRLRQLPGVLSVGISDTLPPSGSMRSTVFASIEIPGRERFEKGTGGMVGWRAVTPDYFKALAIGIVRGRGFTEEDRRPSESPIILSETLSKILFADEDPIGKQMRFGLQNGPWRRIVGIAADVKNNGLTAHADPEFYLPWKDDPVQSVDSVQIVVRNEMNAKAAGSWMRTETAGLDPTLPVTIDTLGHRLERLVQPQRFNATLLTLFAGIGLFLAAIGIYGVVRFLVAQQTREIGVRMALGATPREICKMVFQTVARWTIVGGLLGVGGSLFCAGLLKSLLFEVQPHDPLVLFVAFMFLSLIAFCAAWIPARQAMRIDPMEALRYE